MPMRAAKTAATRPPMMMQRMAPRKLPAFTPSTFPMDSGMENWMAPPSKYW